MCRASPLLAKSPIARRGRLAAVRSRVFSAISSGKTGNGFKNQLSPSAEDTGQPALQALLVGLLTRRLVS